MATISLDLLNPTEAPPGDASRSELAADARALSNALGGLLRVVQFRDRDRACCHDVSVSQCYALGAVVADDGLTVNDLAGQLYLDKSTASRIANGLVQRGLLARRRDEEDGRIVRLIATPEGRRVHDLIESDLVTDYASLLADFEPEVRRGVVQVIDALGASFAARVETDGGTCCVVPRPDA